MVSLFSPVEPSVYEARGRMPAEQLGTTAYDFHQAYDYAMQHAAELGLTEAITELYYSFEYNFYGAGFGEHDSNQGNAWLFFHGTDGRCSARRFLARARWGSSSTCCNRRSTAGAFSACRVAS